LAATHLSEASTLQLDPPFRWESKGFASLFPQLDRLLIRNSFPVLCM
jgi:hypothetical protein